MAKAKKPVKKLAKKTVPKKTPKAAKKTVKKAVKKTVKKSVKKVIKKTVKKAAAKKTAPKKVTAKKATIKKAAPKKVSKPAIKKTTFKAPVAIQPKIEIQKFITPLDDRIIAEVEKGEKRTAGGLYIPETAQISGNFKAKVLAAGRGHKDKKGRIRPMDVQAGDWVLFSEYAGQPIELMGKEYLLLRESDILGIVTNS